MKNQIDVFDISGKSVTTADVAESIMIEEPHQQSMFDAVIAENASKHRGTHSTLTKAEVSGGGKKPYRQKHTGRARQGSIRNPHYRHGGVVFGPKPGRNYKIKLTRKVYALALKSAFSLHMINGTVLGISDDLVIDKPSTKLLVNFLKSLNLFGDKVLFVTNSWNDNLHKSIANLTNVDCRTWNRVSPRDLMHYQHVIIQPSVMKKWIGVY